MTLSLPIWISITCLILSWHCSETSLRVCYRYVWGDKEGYSPWSTYVWGKLLSFHCTVVSSTDGPEAVSSLCPLVRSAMGETETWRGRPGLVVRSTLICALHSLRWIIMTQLANDMKLGGIADMLKDTARIEDNLGRLEKWFGRRVEWHRVKKSAVSGTSE